MNTITTQSATKSFIDWMYSVRYEDLPGDVRKMVQLALYDGIGNIMACSMLPVAHRLFNFIRLTGDSSHSTVIGFPQRTSVINAALVNGTLGHADEVDAIDDPDSRGNHVIAVSMAAALTAGQLAGASGSEVLRAVVLGYELAKRVHSVAAKFKEATGTDPGPFDEGNTMGAAAVAGISLGLSPDQMDVALSLAGHLACGITPFKRETRHMAKSFTRGGVGAKNGVTAALMAKAGYDAPRDILDGVQGFFHSYLGVEDPGPGFLAGLGQEYCISSLIFKRNSCGFGLQAPRQALLELITEHSLTHDEIAEIQIEMRPSDISSYFTSQRHPADCGDSLALAAVYGGMGFKEAHQEKFSSSTEFRAMRARIKVLPREDWANARFRLHTSVTISTKDGRKLTKETDYRQMNEEDLDTKFSHLVGLRVGEPKAEELAGVLKQLDTTGNIANVMVQLEFPEAAIEEV